MEGVTCWGDPSPLEVCVGVHYFSESAAQSAEIARNPRIPHTDDLQCAFRTSSLQQMLDNLRTAKLYSWYKGYSLTLLAGSWVLKQYNKNPKP